MAKPLKGDRALRERAMTRPPVNGLPVRRSADGRTFRCPHCGRVWSVIGTHDGIGGRVLKSTHGRAAGFISSAANNHASTCAGATPEERRAIARLDIVRWEKNPPVQIIEIDYGHPGYGNEPIWPESS